MINTVVFDLDGTLLDTLADLTDSVNYAMLQMHYKTRTIEEVRQFVGNGVAKLIERALPEGRSNPDYEEVLRIFKEHYAVHCMDKTKPYDGILELLEKLRQKGYQLAIVSNKFDKAVKELNQIYFQNRIPVAIGESDKIRKKPAPDTVYQALEELAVSPSQAVYVGDSDVDIATAGNVPMPCISVTWGFRTREQLLAAGAKEDCMITAPEKLLPLLLQMSAEA